MANPKAKGAKGKHFRCKCEERYEKEDYLAMAYCKICETWQNNKCLYAPHDGGIIMEAGIEHFCSDKCRDENVADNREAASKAEERLPLQGLSLNEDANAKLKCRRRCGCANCLMMIGRALTHDFVRTSRDHCNQMAVQRTIFS